MTLKLSQILIGAGLALFGVCFGFAIATSADTTAHAKWWELMTAFGTLAAVLVAIVVPMSERLARERTEREQRVVQDWANARDVTICISQLKEICRPGAQMLITQPPRTADLEMIRVKLDSIAARNHDPLGAAVMARSLEEAAAIRYYLHTAKDILERSLAYFHLSQRGAQFEALERQESVWMDQILRRATKLGISLERR